MRILLIASLIALASCAGADETAASGPDARPSAQALAALADTFAVARSTTPRRAALRRALVRAGVSPFGDGRLEAEYQTSLGVPLVGGYVPGRHPIGRTDLVVLGTRVDGAGVPAVLEAARVLAERSQWANVPERSVEVAFWPAGDGVRQVLRSSLWPRGAIRAVVVAGGEGAATVDGVPVTRLPLGGDAVALAAALVDSTLALARVPPPPPDTLVTAR